VNSYFDPYALGQNIWRFIDDKFGSDEGIDKVKVKRIVKNADAVVVPAGTRHNIINISKTVPLKLYTIYSPPNHPPKTIHKTKKEAEKAEAKHH